MLLILMIDLDTNNDNDDNNDTMNTSNNTNHNTNNTFRTDVLASAPGCPVPSPTRTELARRGGLREGIGRASPPPRRGRTRTPRWPTSRRGQSCRGPSSPATVSRMKSTQRHRDTETETHTRDSKFCSEPNMLRDAA